MGTIFLSILGVSVSTGAIVIVLLLLTPFLNKRYAAKWKYLIWIFLALRLLIPFSGVDGPHVIDRLSQLNVQTVSGTEGNDTGDPADPANVTTPYRRIVVEIPAQMTTPIRALSEKEQTGMTLLDIAALVWMIGSLLFIAVHLISYLHYKRQVVKKGRVIKEASILRQLYQLQRGSRSRRTVCVMEYHEAESPMMIGFFKPILVLPKEQYSSEDLFFILKHELVHLKRGDMYLKLLFVIANAVHWFDPLIWIMHKEAVIDMELSCDEQVTKGTSHALRKAYTETLLSMLHKRCVRKTVLSTQFYGGTQIMKKRFQNILIRTRKKNGILLLIGTAVLTVSLGSLISCSVAKEDTGNADIKNEGAADESIGNVSERSTLEAVPAGSLPADDPSVVDGPTFADGPLEDTITLTFSKEGEQEQKQAALAVGNGYSLYLPDDEQWHLSAPDLWTTDSNEQVALWVTHFEEGSLDLADQKLEEDGYAKEDAFKWWKQEGDLLYHVEQKVFEDTVWEISYSYPIEFEEGWGREFPVIVSTFALSDGTDGAMADDAAGAGGYLQAEDPQKIQTVLYAFTKAYFDGDVDAIRKLLASTYEGEPDIYGGTGAISDLTIKGVSDADAEKIENGLCNVSVEFRDSDYEDMFLYLTCILVREEEDWKIRSYGVEG